MSERPFSMTIGERYLTVSDVEIKSGLYQINALGFEENTANIYRSEGKNDFEMTTALMQKLVRDTAVKKKQVNVVIPDTYTYSQIIEMPILTEKELLSAIKYQADQFIPVPIDEVDLDIEVLYEDKKNKKLALLLVACPLLTLDKITNSVEAAGLAPGSIENETSAFFRLAGDMAGRQKKPDPALPLTLYINFGHSSTSLYLYHQAAGTPLQIHNFSLGYSIFLKDIQANYNASEADAKKLLATIGFSSQQSSYNLPTILASPYASIFGEIERFMIAAKSRFNLPIARVLIFGEGLGVLALEKQLATSLGTTIGLFDLYSYCVKNNVVDFFKNNLPLFVPGVGAGLRS